MPRATPEGGGLDARLGPGTRIVAADFDDARVRDLLALHFAAMRGQSPAGACHVLDLGGLQSPDIALYALWQDDRLLGLGGLKALDAATGEIKSMRTAPDALGRGVGARILECLIGEARIRGYRRLSLETGSGPDFAAALALYRRRGFVDGPPFGGYAPTPFTTFLHLDLLAEIRDEFRVRPKG